MPASQAGPEGSIPSSRTIQKDSLQMYEHLWFYPVKFGKVLDLLTINIWIDHGFDIWSNKIIRLNRVITEKSPIPDHESDPGVAFLKQLLEGKRGYVKINKARANGRYDR